MQHVRSVRLGCMLFHYVGSPKLIFLYFKYYCVFPAFSIYVIVIPILSYSYFFHSYVFLFLDSRQNQKVSCNPNTLSFTFLFFLSFPIFVIFFHFLVFLFFSNQGLSFSYFLSFSFTTRLHYSVLSSE